MVIALQLLSVFILLLACVLIVNTMSALLTEQRQQLGVMKAVGATSRQLSVLYRSYRLVLGVIAMLLAFPLSLLAGRAMGRARCRGAASDLDDRRLGYDAARRTDGVRVGR